MTSPLKSLLLHVGVWICLLPATVARPAAEPPEKTLAPYFFIENGDPLEDRLPLKKTSVTANINSVIAEVSIVQEYANAGERPINARYLFPASTRAAVHGMTMTIGDQVVSAVVRERREARQTFTSARKAGKSASLLEQRRPNVFTMDVANIMPGDRVLVELRYTELLVPEEGVYRFVFPAVVGPRYSGEPESAAGENDLWIKNPYLKVGSAPVSAFHLDLTVSAGLPLHGMASPSHDIDIAWKNQSTAGITLKTGEAPAGNRDFILDYRLAGGAIESGLMLFEGREENFFLLMAQPPEKVRAADIPPREYVFVVDVSGSMHGFPLNTAKKLLRNLIGGLKPTDRFNVILFAGGADMLSPASLPADPAHIDRANRLIDSRRGGGGTELYAALEKALALPKNEAYARTVLLVTDGYIAAERKTFHLIRRHLNRTNLFTFGIGSSVNRYLVEGLARAGMGEPFVVTRPEEAAATARRFREYVAAPVLTGIEITFDGFDAYDILPPALPDMLARRPVAAIGKWRGNPAGSIRITGTGGSGPYVEKVDVAASAPLERNSALPYLWARTRLADLSDVNPRKGDPETRSEITSLGLTYNLLTAHTSFVAVNEIVRNPEKEAGDVTQPLPLPAGVSNLAVGVGFRKVPEPELALLLAFLFLLAIAARRFRGRK